MSKNTTKFFYFKMKVLIKTMFYLSFMILNKK